jgi:hypothetical protein
VISDTRIFRATYLLFLERNQQPLPTSLRAGDGKDGPTSGHGPAKPLRALTELPDDLILTIVEDITEMDGMITTWAIILHPLTG